MKDCVPLRKHSPKTEISLREIKTLCAFEMCSSLWMHYSLSVQAPCCQLLSSMCALTRLVCLKGQPLSFLPFPSLPQDAAGEKGAGGMANAKGPVER